MSEVPIESAASSPFVTAADLVGLPGAPFSDTAVAAAVAQIRLSAGWHIAPVISETIVVDSAGGRELWLPTRRVEAVTSVEVWQDGEWRPWTGWDAQTGWSEAGILSSRNAFPVARRSVRVTLTHGYPVTDDLKLLAAVSSGRRIAAESISSRSVTFADAGDVYGASAILAAYSLGPRP